MTAAALYDLFMLVGAGLVVAGMSLMLGVGAALVTAGVMVMGLTYFGARR